MTQTDLKQHLNDAYTSYLENNDGYKLLVDHIERCNFITNFIKNNESLKPDFCVCYKLIEEVIREHDLKTVSTH